MTTLGYYEVMKVTKTGKSNEAWGLLEYPNNREGKKIKGVHTATMEHITIMQFLCDHTSVQINEFDGKVLTKANVLKANIAVMETKFMKLL